MNKLFQAQSADVTIMTEDLLKVYRNIMQMIVEPTHLSKCPVEKLPGLKFLDHLIPVPAIHFGHEFNTIASACPLNDDQVA